MAKTNEIIKRIAAIESELTALKALVQADSKPVESQAGNVARKAVIERARAFVSGHTRFALDNVEFYVNPKKGVVTALKKSRYGTVLRKAFARCAPGDVFNADIGKAIAVGRLYGVEVPAEFFDAPKPDEPVAGQLIQSIEKHSGRIRFTHRVLKGENTDGIRSALVGDEKHAYAKIIDDTEAQY